MSEQEVNPHPESNQPNGSDINDELEENEKAQGRWNDEQHLRFLNGVMQHGKDWKLVEKVVKTRTGTQVRSHAQKYFMKFRRQQKDKKKNKNKQLLGPTQLEEEIIRSFTQGDITKSTPPQLAAVLQVSSTLSRQFYKINSNNQGVELVEGEWSSFEEKVKGRRKISDDLHMPQRKMKINGKEHSNLDLWSKLITQTLPRDQNESFFISTIKNNLHILMEPFNFYDITDIKDDIPSLHLQTPKKSFLHCEASDQKEQKTEQKKKDQEGDRDNQQN